MQHKHPRKKLQLKDILPAAIVATGFGAFGAVFVAVREWVPGLITLGIALIIILSLVVRALRPQAAAPTERPKLKSTLSLVETHPFLVVLTAIPLGVLCVWLLVSGQILAGLVVLSFPLILLLGVAAELASRRLGRDMRSTEHVIDDPRATQHLPDIALVMPTTLLPVRPFAITVFDADNLPPTSEATKAFIEQRRQLFIESIHLNRRGAEFLWCWLAGLLLFGLLFVGSVPPNTRFVWWGMALHIGMRVFKSKKSWDVALWLWCVFLNIGWFGGIIYVSYFYTRGMLSGKQTTWIQAASALLILLAGLGVFMYLRKMRREKRTFQEKVFANRPVKLLFLWVFGSNLVLKSLMSGIGTLWGLFGSMQVLCGRGFMGDLSQLTSAFFSRKPELLVETPEQLHAKLNTFKYSPHWSGRYYTNTLLCHDRVWQLALHTLIDHTDVVVMNLGGFSAENEGCIYELGQLIDHLPTERFVLLVDQTTDMDALLAILQQAWSAMAPHSPNRATTGSIQLYRVKWLNVEPPPEESPSQFGAPDSGVQLSFGPKRTDARDRHVEATRAEVELLIPILCEGVLRTQSTVGDVNAVREGASP